MKTTLKFILFEQGSYVDTLGYGEPIAVFDNEQQCIQYIGLVYPTCKRDTLSVNVLTGLPNNNVFHDEENDQTLVIVQCAHYDVSEE